MTDTPTHHCAYRHAFDAGNPSAERGARWVLWLTLATMVVEIAAGWWFNSMALLADGWHMSSHAFAIGLTALAYAAARKLSSDPSFAFGTWKIEVLAGYSSALFLLAVAAMMVLGSVERLLEPQPIRYLEAMVVAVLGLVVNLASALILGHAGEQGDHHHGHGHSHHHAHGPGHDDLNLRAAYLHVLTDAATSVLAIVALAGGWWLGWSWLDPVMGILGAIVVAIWAKGLVQETGKVLLDREMDDPVVDEIREVIDTQGARHGLRLTDLHVWRVGRSAWACALTLTGDPNSPGASEVRQWLSIHEEIVHVTVEMQYR
ncbi:MAG: CDF family Co(II)/Ni(II) efflux transporter DmeF [Burkholderiaceae bacterium]